MIYIAREPQQKREKKKNRFVKFPWLAGIHECIPHVIPFRRESYECVKSKTLALSVLKL